MARMCAVRSACVAGSGAVAPPLLERGQETGDQVGVQDGDVQVGRLDAGAFVGVARQQPVGCQKSSRLWPALMAGPVTAG